MPFLLKFATKQGGPDGCHHIYAHVRSASIVEVYSGSYSVDYILYRHKDLILQQFIFHCIIDTLGLSVVFGVTGFGHTDTYIVIS